MDTRITLAITGDTVINRRLSVYRDERFMSVVKLVREADVAYTHLETVIHDYDGPEVYPAAEGGWTWMRSPRYVVDELKWMGFDMVSQASNHALDYAYGGLISTINALDEGGIVHAGTGRNLAEAREPAYLDTGNGRVALLSMCSSFATWARAGEARRDVKGRPGLNPLRFYYQVDAGSMETIVDLARRMGWWVTQVGENWLLNPAGVHNTVYRFVKSETAGIRAVADEDDVEGNLNSLRDARKQADYVLVNIHNHEWDPQFGLSAPPPFVPQVARLCIDNGADVVVAQGSPATLRGIEVYKVKAIFYDPGDFIMMNNTVTRLPADSYWRAGNDAAVRRWDATPSQNYDARGSLLKPLCPPGGYFSGRVLGSVLSVCSLSPDGTLADMKLYPLTVPSKPRSQCGIPRLASAEKAQKIIEYLAELSAPYRTRIEFRDGVGIVRL